jgi:hypothetical protein
LADDRLARDDSLVSGNRMGEERCVCAGAVVVGARFPATGLRGRPHASRSSRKRSSGGQEEEPVEERVVERIVEKTDVDRSD